MRKIFVKIIIHFNHNLFLLKKLWNTIKILVKILSKYSLPLDHSLIFFISMIEQMCIINFYSNKISLVINLLIYLYYHHKQCKKLKFKALHFKKHFHKLEDFYL